MESSSQFFGVNAEECESSESGWTMYIGSPINHSDDGTDDDADDKNYNNHDGCDDESDDSMASDACSGPSHQGGMTTHFKQQEEERNVGKYQEIEKKGNKKMVENKRSETKRKEEKREKVVVGRRGSSYAPKSIRSKTK